MSNPDIGFDPSNVSGAEAVDRPTSALAVRAFRIYFVCTCGVIYSYSETRYLDQVWSLPF